MGRRPAAPGAVVVHTERVEDDGTVASYQVGMVADSDRIARDLHDVVVQRLFAIGLQIEHISTVVADPSVAAALSRAVDDLDETIRYIRTTIFQLQQDHQSLRGGCLDLVAEYARVLGVAPDLEIRGPVDHTVPDRCRDDVLAVLREALSNVARHAAASSVAVEVVASASDLTLTVVDDGVGLPALRVESGLRNARQRAEVYGGTLSLSGAVPNGTRLVWSVPLS